MSHLLGRRGASADVVSRGHLLTEARRVVDRLLALGRAIQLACLLCAVITVANAMFVTVLERRWHYALQRTLGMTKRDLRRCLVLEAMSVGQLGGVGGVLFGVGGGYAMVRAMNSGFGWHLGFHVSPLLATGVILAAAVVCAVAGGPAIRIATRTDPAEALRAQLGAGTIRRSPVNRSRTTASRAG